MPLYWLCYQHNNQISVVMARNRLNAINYMTT
jgi:hypothetical protein